MIKLLSYFLQNEIIIGMLFGIVVTLILIGLYVIGKVDEKE